MSSKFLHGYRAVGLVFALLASACAHKPIAAPPATPQESTVAAKPTPPPPQPKCESLDDKCTAAADTHCDVGDAGAWFTPPEGWFYAKESTGSIAQAADGLALVAFAPAATDKPKDVVAALEPLLSRLHVEKVKTKKLEKRLKKPQSTVDAGDAKVRLWEVDKAKQGVAPELDGKKGSLLVVLVAPSPDHAIVGLSFVVKPGAEDRVGAIMQSVQSLRGSR